LTRLDPADEVEARKAEHLHLGARRDVDSRAAPGWADVRLAHEALPVADLDEIDLGADFLGHRLRAPLMIAGMTGGHSAAREVNVVLAAAADRHGLAMGLGSQRAALRSPRLAHTYSVARELAPRSLLVANIGAAQLVRQRSGEALGPEQLRAAVEMLRADALAIHLNFLEEAIQPEGDRAVAGLREAIPAAVAAVEVPSIAKETGAGMSRTAALELAGMGFSALDVGGVGGTSFAAVEGERAAERGDRRGATLGRVFRDWGVPTAVSVVGAAAAGLPVVATGGVRTGLDAACAIALGATMVGVARPLLVAALEGEAAVDAWIAQFLEELRLAVFLTGGRSLAHLRTCGRVILGDTRRWIEDLGYV
jgi:isopentenyl-diphosphate delta-isomerase